MGHSLSLGLHGPLIICSPLLLGLTASLSWEDEHHRDPSGERRRARDLTLCLPRRPAAPAPS